MPIRSLLRVLLNNEQLTQKVAESYPIRRAAQLTAYVFHRGKELGEDGLEKIRESETVHRVQQEARTSGQRASNFSNTFTKELREGFKDIKDEMNRKR